MRYFLRSRTNWLAIVLLLAMAVFVVRLFQLQIVQHGTYTDLARASQQRQLVLPANRGLIYMMDGKTPVQVVLNRAVYTVVADPQIVDDEQKQEIIASLKEVAGGEIEPDIEKKLDNRQSRYEVLARNISKTQAEKLKKKDFAGILYQSGSMRNYPEGALGAHVLGFVNTDGKGQYGIEGSLDDRLKGQDGMLRSVTDVRNVPLVIGKDNMRIEPKSGENIVLTVDRNIQSHAEAALKAGVEKAGATEGSVIVMDPSNGQILAMANTPSYSPADYAKQTDASIFMNNATMTPFEPGSIIKSFSFAMAIDKGVITPSTTYYNTDCIKVVDRTMCNALYGLTGTMTMQGAFSNSLNVGTLVAIRRLGDGSHIDLRVRQTMYDYYNKFGFGRTTGIELAETSGYIFPPDSQEGNEVRYSAMAYGQSMNLTMVQVAAGFSSLINGGNYYKPTIVKGTISDNGTVAAAQNSVVRQTVSSSTSQQMKQMLTTARGTYALFANVDKPGYEIGGKTGTAEAVVNGAYTLDETIGTYIGYGGGVNSPRYVIMVRVAAPGQGKNIQGNYHAGPIFTDISNWLIDYMKIAPKE